MTLAVIMLLMTAAYAQKRTNYKFKFEYAVEIESEDQAACDVVFEIVDRPGETPYLNMVNNKNGEEEREELMPVIIHNKADDSMIFSNAKKDEMYYISMQTGEEDIPSCIVLVMDSPEGESPKAQFGITNETGSANDKECTATYNALVKNIKLKNFNNFTVEALE